MAHRNDAKEAEKAAKEAAKERIRQQIEDEISARMEKEDRMRDALHLLGKEEADRRREAAERAKKQKERAMREEMQWANQQQQRHKVVVLEEERAIEDDTLRRMQAKFDADEVAARRKEEERKAAREQYKYGVNRQMLERSEMYHAAQQVDVEQARAAQAEAEYKAKIIEEARKRILQAHAAQLQGYLPKGVLQKESDLEFLRQSPPGPRGATR